MKKYGITIPEKENDRTRKIYLTGKPMYYGDDNARTFNLLIDSGVEVSVNGFMKDDMSEVKIGDKAVFSFNMADIKNTHPNYHPWHLMVVTKGKMTE